LLCSVTTHQCSHLVIDAGHIAVESDLADKGALREIQAKRNKPYAEDDYKRLESLMYDKMSLKLQAAQVSVHIEYKANSNASNFGVQFVLGNDLQACRDALISEKSDTLHLLERINLNLRVHNSIVPSVLSLARFKISGKLPSLQVNVSDAKYKALMRILDVAIPNFDEGGDKKPPQSHIDAATLALPLPASLFGPAGTEYNVDDDGANSEGASTHKDDLFFEASDGSLEVVFHVILRLPYFHTFCSILKSDSTSLSLILRWTPFVVQSRSLVMMAPRNHLGKLSSSSFDLRSRFSNSI